MEYNYLFSSDRLGFRNWSSEDLAGLAAINQDPEVMAHFPELISREDTESFIERMQAKCEAKGYCYFAVDELQSNSFIGFIGLSDQDFEASFTPCVDIGWRLARNSWGKGYATEGARRCLLYAFEELQLKEVMALCPVVNIGSWKVMHKIGMHRRGTFKHPVLKGYPELETCYLYELRHDS